MVNEAEAWEPDLPLYEKCAQEGAGEGEVMVCGGWGRGGENSGVFERRWWGFMRGSES